MAQIDRIAAARNLSPDDLKILIEQNTEGRFLGIFGEPAVNTVTLNLALDQL
ncbi:potassium-transporting ATPase subunit C [Picosynechococcus sp. OG1]|uniref:potassium-transporting ATPase subunit C n=1 Tax=Picosynechococcus sp. OG1 TaxID=1938863 RepID=UPI0028F41171|nr:potassium-transporting ATPase subunit C [Picosynechococcus sp. OG1]